MLKNLSPFLVFLLLIAIVGSLFYFTVPRNFENTDISETEFSTARAFVHVQNIARAPHYVGSSNHSKVRNYIVNELQDLGFEVQTQEGYVINKKGGMSFARNILARVPGDDGGKSLVLMSHYDSDGHSSPGASDAASGVAVILEGIRAFLAQNERNKNDIIILFTDAEEMGLLGAKLFTDKHPWAQNVGLALNFESRGSGGNSFMFPETNAGNSRLIEHFINADLQFPVSYSLVYSIYKMLPNDTDLTVLRENGNINGFNFAFIDDHFDYHTANDVPANLDKETLAHQGSNLMPLLGYFKDVDLSDLNGEEDLIYFSLPGGEIISYPFSWIFPMIILGLILFLGVLVYGFYKKRFNPKLIIKGAVPFLISLIVSAILVFLIWQFCFMIYPEYREMEHGFTYNGYWYIAAAIFLTLAINFLVYHQFKRIENLAGYFVFPVFFWLLICLLIAFILPGGAYFIVPAFFAILQLSLLIWKKKPNIFLMLLLSLPALIILLPIITTIPVALGLKVLFFSSILTTLLFTLFLPVFGLFTGKKLLGLLCFVIFNILFIIAHFNSSFTEKKQKPNSLVYLYNADTGKASWNSYDYTLDSWNEPFFENDLNRIKDPVEDFSSEFSSGFTYNAPAPEIAIPEPGIVFEKMEIVDSVEITARYSLKIAPNRKIHRIELFADVDVNFEEFRVNSLEADSVYLGSQAFHVFTKRWKNKLLTYHAANSDTLRIEFVIEPEKLPEFILYEASYDLLENPDLQVPARAETMIPRPFLLNDAVIIKKTINL